MDIGGFDLNLLKAFDALYAERHVTRAGTRVGLSQSAMSGCLTRLRELLEDELFVRTPAGMQPTPRAQDLSGPISEALRLLRVALQADAFDPLSAQFTITIAMTDYAAFVLLPPLMTRLNVQAPLVDVRVSGIFGRDEAIARLDSGEANLAIGFPAEASARILIQPLFREEFVCIARHGHAAFAGGGNLEGFAAAQHLLISPEGDRSGIVDQKLAAFGLDRRVVLSLPQFLAAPFVVAETDLVATLAKRVAQKFLASGAGIDLHEPPLELPTWPLSMMWHRRADTHASSTWMRTLVAEVARSL